MKIHLTISVLHLSLSLLHLFSDAEAFGQSPTKDLSRAEIQSVSLAASLKQNKLEPGEDDVRTDEAETKTNKDVKKNLTEIKGVEVMDAHGEGAETKGK